MTMTDKQAVTVLAVIAGNMENFKNGPDAINLPEWSDRISALRYASARLGRRQHKTIIIAGACLLGGLVAVILAAFLAYQQGYQTGWQRAIYCYDTEEMIMRGTALETDSCFSTDGATK